MWKHLAAVLRHLNGGAFVASFVGFGLWAGFWLFAGLQSEFAENPHLGVRATIVMAALGMVGYWWLGCAFLHSGARTVAHASLGAWAAVLVGLASVALVNYSGMPWGRHVVQGFNLATMFLIPPAVQSIATSVATAAAAWLASGAGRKPRQDLALR